QEIETQHREAESDTGNAETGKRHAYDIEGLVLFGTQVVDIAGGKRDAEEVYWYMDDGDPVPACVGCDESADRRPYCATHALHDGRDDEFGEGARQRAAD